MDEPLNPTKKACWDKAQEALDTAHAVGNKLFSGQAGPLVAGSLAVAVPNLAANAAVVLTQADKTGADATTTGYRVTAQGPGTFTIEAYATANAAAVAGDVTALLNWVARNP